MVSQSDRSSMEHLPWDLEDDKVLADMLHMLAVDLPS